MTNPKLKKIMDEVKEAFLQTDDPQEKIIYQFFKNEIKPSHIVGTQFDLPLTGKSRIKRKYVNAIWKLPSFFNTHPWIRFSIPSNNLKSNIEIVLPVFHGDIPKIWSSGKDYFRMVLSYKAKKKGPTIRLVTNSIDVSDLPEILEVTKKFHRTIKNTKTSSKIK